MRPPEGRSPIKKHLLEGLGYFLGKWFHSAELAIRAEAPVEPMRLSRSWLIRSQDE